MLCLFYSTLVIVVLLFVCFFKQKTAYEMRISDWSSDVCSSDLVRFAPPVGVPLRYRVTTRRIGRDGTLIDFALVYALQWQRTGRGYRLDSVLERIEIGRASCRERVDQDG